MTLYIPAFWLGVIAAHAFWISAAIIVTVWKNRNKRKDGD